MNTNVHSCQFLTRKKKERIYLTRKRDNALLCSSVRSSTSMINTAQD